MFEIYFFIVIIWILFFLALKLLKDFAMTVIFAILILIFGFYGMTGGFVEHNIFTNAISIAHFFLGFYWIVRCSIELILQKGKYKEKWEVVPLKCQKKS